MKTHRTLIAGSIYLITFVGCESNETAPARPSMALQETPQSREAATRELAAQVLSFDADVQKLPGATGEDHRQALVALLARLPKILQLANGPVESPEFKLRLSVIDSARKTVSDNQIDHRRMEAVENQALQAASPALAEISRRFLFDDDQMPMMLQALDEKVSAAAMPVGPMHDLDATNAFGALASVLDHVTAEMQERFSVAQ